MYVIPAYYVGRICNYVDKGIDNNALIVLVISEKINVMYKRKILRYMIILRFEHNL